MLAQQPEAADVLLRRRRPVGATVAREGFEFGVVDRRLALGGQVLTLRGLQGEYDEVFLPLHGAYQAQNAVCALAAVEAFLGTGTGGAVLDKDVVREAFAKFTSPAAGVVRRPDHPGRRLAQPGRRGHGGDAGRSSRSTTSSA